MIAIHGPVANYGRRLMVKQSKTLCYQFIVEVCRTAYGLDTGVAQHDFVVTLAYRSLLNRVVQCVMVLHWHSHTFCFWL